MGALKLCAAALALSLGSPAHGQAVERWRPIIAEASTRFGIPEPWIDRVMRAESGGRTHWRGRPITSRAGAMGLMQLMPGTWAELRARLGLGGDPHAPRDNIIAGTAYLRAMYDRFGYPGCFAAYNAGPARYAAYIAGRAALPTETRNYLASTAGTSVSHGTAMPVPSPLFFALGAALAGPRVRDRASAGALFVPLSQAGD
jgi:soluble lytic murein transglycosylase-like protein